MSPKKKKRSSWRESDLKAAITAMRTGEMSSYKAAETYNIPRRTLRDYLKSGSSKRTLGRKAVFTSEQEKDFTNRIMRFADLGIPMTAKMIRKQAFVFCEMYNIPNNFNKEARIAGRDWLKLFLKRNPIIAKRKAQFLNQARGQKLNKAIVSHHFKEVEKLYTELNIQYNPERIYNMDEKGCRLTMHKQPTVIAKKGAKRVHIQASEHGENVTIVGCANAVGNPIPPMVLFKGVRRNPDYEKNLPPGSIVKMARKGSMTCELYIDFLRHFAKHKTEGNCLLIFDGAKCHLDLKIAEEADRLGITLYCLPSNTTHELQPLDKSCYKPFESYWDQEVMEHFYKTHAQKLSRLDFNRILSKIWFKCMSHGNITSGFRATGLYPLDPNILPESAFAPSVLTEQPVPQQNTSQDDALDILQDLFQNDNAPACSSPHSMVEHFFSEVTSPHSIVPAREFTASSPLHSDIEQLEPNASHIRGSTMHTNTLHLNVSQTFKRLVAYSSSTDISDDEEVGSRLPASAPKVTRLCSPTSKVAAQSHVEPHPSQITPPKHNYQRRTSDTYPSTSGLQTTQRFGYDESSTDMSNDEVGFQLPASAPKVTPLCSPTSKVTAQSHVEPHPSQITPPKHNCQRRLSDTYPSTSGLQTTQRFGYDGSSTDASSDTEIMTRFITRPCIQQSLRIYSSGSESDVDAEDNVPLLQLSTKSQFEVFLPTPNYAITKNKKQRRKAINYKGQRITKDLFNDMKEIKKKPSSNATPKTGNITKKTPGEKKIKTTKKADERNITKYKTGPNEIKPKSDDKDQSKTKRGTKINLGENAGEKIKPKTDEKEKTKTERGTKRKFGDNAGEEINSKSEDKDKTKTRRGTKINLGENAGEEIKSKTDEKEKTKTERGTKRKFGDNAGEEINSKSNDKDKTKTQRGTKRNLGKHTNKTTSQNRKIIKEVKKGKENETDEWYCYACYEDRKTDMRPCVDCRKWYHEECIGLTETDVEVFRCPDGCD